jgi:hypothetical protein
MSRFVFLFSVAILTIPVSSQAQKSVEKLEPRLVAFAAEDAADPMGGGGGGQAYPSAIKGGPFAHVVAGVTVSSLGIGAQLGTRVSPHFDARLFGNYLNLTHRFTDSGFDMKLNMNLPNIGAKVDFYPLHRFPLRISPGYLFFNQNQVRVDYRAQPGNTFTVNNINWRSDDADPVRGIGHLSLQGTGPMITAGLGHIMSHSSRRFTFPFEVGVVFIHTPVVTLTMQGQICADGQSQCQPAATYPTFAENLSQQVADWNRTAAPYHVYPIVEGGVAYSFNWSRRGSVR